MVEQLRRRAPGAGAAAHRCWCSWSAAGSSACFGWIDPFFFGQPSGVVEKLIDWFQNGTSIGPYGSRSG
jgi:hypothetical protein